MAFDFSRYDALHAESLALTEAPRMLAAATAERDMAKSSLGSAQEAIAKNDASRAT